MISLKPVMKEAAIGLTPMSPVMAEVGTVEMPLLARMAKSSAVLRSTGAVAAAVATTRATRMHLNIAMYVVD